MCNHAQAQPEAQRCIACKPCRLSPARVVVVVVLNSACTGPLPRVRDCAQGSLRHAYPCHEYILKYNTRLMGLGLYSATQSFPHRRPAIFRPCPPALSTRALAYLEDVHRSSSMAM